MMRTDRLLLCFSSLVSLLCPNPSQQRWLECLSALSTIAQCRTPFIASRWAMNYLLLFPSVENWSDRRMAIPCTLLRTHPCQVLVQLKNCMWWLSKILLANILVLQLDPAASSPIFHVQVTPLSVPDCSSTFIEKTKNILISDMDEVPLYY